MAVNTALISFPRGGTHALSGTYGIPPVPAITRVQLNVGGSISGRLDMPDIRPVSSEVEPIDADQFEVDMMKVVQNVRQR